MKASSVNLHDCHTTVSKKTNTSLFKKWAYTQDCWRPALTSSDDPAEQFYQPYGWIQIRMASIALWLKRAYQRARHDFG